MTSFLGKMEQWSIRGGGERNKPYNVIIFSCHHWSWMISTWIFAVISFNVLFCLDLFLIYIFYPCEWEPVGFRPLPSPKLPWPPAQSFYTCFLTSISCAKELIFFSLSQREWISLRGHDMREVRYSMN